MKLLNNKVLIGVVGLGLLGLIAGGLALGKSTSRVGIYRSHEDAARTLKLQANGDFTALEGSRPELAGRYTIKKGIVTLILQDERVVGSGMVQHDRLLFARNGDYVIVGTWEKD